MGQAPGFAYEVGGQSHVIHAPTLTRRDRGGTRHYTFVHHVSSRSTGQVLITRSGSSPRSSARSQP